MSACTPEPKDEKKTVSFTGAVTSVTVNSAILTAYANLPADVTGDVIMGVVYSTSSSPDFQNGRILTSKELDENNMYQIEVTDLTPNTKYYYKSFLSYNDQTYYGEVKEFTTVQVLASVSTLEAWDVTETKARLGGIVSVFNAGDVKREAAIYYGTDGSDIEVLKTKGSRIGIDDISEDGMFTVNLNALTPSTKYYFVAVVSVEGVEFAGAIKNFTTQDRPTGISVTGESSDVEESSAKLFGWCNQEGAEGTSVVFGIEYSATDLTTAATSITASEKDAENKYCCQATGLSSNTVYYYRAFTLFNGVRSYGEVKSFTTLDFTATITCYTEDVGETTATVSGSLTVTSKETLRQSVTLYYDTKNGSVENLMSNGQRKSISLNQDGSFSANLSSLKNGTTYYYVAVAYVHDKSFNSTVNSFTTLTRNCPSGAVDLGLSVCWATCNLCESGFVSSPEQYGDYFAWGETSSKLNVPYGWSSYKWGNGSYYSLTKYNTHSSDGTVDNKTTLDSEDDVAHVKLGGSWRMPTDAEWTELQNNCTWTWTSNYNGTGVAGRIVTSNVEGYKDKSIFLPAAGYRHDTSLSRSGSDGDYWSSSLLTDYPDLAWFVDFSSAYVRRDGSYRYNGFSVRPVSE